MKSSLKTTAYQELKQRLISCDYKPGSILKESDLATELGISRTPVREAISLLESEGYLMIAPKKGIFVTDISLNDVIQIFQVRVEIEPITLKMAAPNINLADLLSLREKFESTNVDMNLSLDLDIEMHRFFVDHCRNKYIIDMMNTVLDKNKRIVTCSPQNRAHVSQAREEHLEILDSLIKQDVELAKIQMKAHVEHCRKDAIDSFYNL